VTTVFYDETDNLIVLDGFKNVVTDIYINDATVTAQVLDADGNEITGITQPIAMAYVASSNGKYRGTAGEAINAVRDDEITIKVLADGGAGLQRTFELQVRVGVDEGP
jgi:hypothetical protein